MSKRTAFTASILGSFGALGRANGPTPGTIAFLTRLAGSTAAALALTACLAPSDSGGPAEERTGSKAAEVKVAECPLPPDNPCDAVPAMLDAVQAQIANATALGLADKAAHASSDPADLLDITYYLRDLDAAQSMTLDMRYYADLSPPNGAAWAYQVHFRTQALWGELWDAGQWSAMSVGHLYSHEGFDASARITSARDLTSQLEAVAIQCYMNYFPLKG